MSKFRGKNKYTKLSDQFIYKDNFFEEGHMVEGPEVFYFDFIEYQMYGAINLEGSSIFPNEENLKNFSNEVGQEQNFRAFNFVTEMFEDVKINMRLAMAMGNIVTTNPILKKMEIKRAYEPPKKKYGTALANHLINFNQSLENNFTSINNITSLDDYVKEFFVFCQENLYNKPITFSGFLQSNQNSLFSTGLAISIADIAFDDDNKKYEKFMNSTSFDYYKKICLNRGFRVNNHIPYMMVADLTSPAITPYLNLTISDTLNTYYNNSFNIDYIILRKYIIDYYNILVERNPFIDKLKQCRTKIKYSFFERSPIAQNNIPEKFNDLFWINYYLDLRNIELGMIKGKSEIKKIKKYLKNFQNKLDNSELVGYIDNMFRLETFRKPFGYYHELRRREQVKKEKDRKEGITGGSTVGGGTSGGY